MTEHFKLVFLPSNTTKIKEFNFSKVKLVLISAALTALLLLIIIMGTKTYYKFELQKYNKDRIAFNRKLLRIQNMVNDLKGEVGIIIKMDDEARTFVNLPKFDEDIRAAGVGGGTVMKLFNSSFYSEEEEVSDGLLSELKELERRIDIEKVSYSEVFEKLKLNQDMIRYWPSIRPVKGGRITDGFGRRRHPINGYTEIHKGIDISVPLGTPIYATADGRVIAAMRNGPYGNYVRINHNTEKYGYATRYGHMNKILVKKGQKVKRGDIIGEVGNTGMSTASHLHYEVLFYGESVNPVEYYYDSAILY